MLVKLKITVVSEEPRSAHGLKLPAHGLSCLLFK